MATALDRMHAGGAPTSPAAERAGPSPLQLIWTIVISFLAAAFVAALINLL
jgi:hypothetical protein